MKTKINQAALNFLLQLRDQAVEKHIRATDAMALMLKQFHLSRVEFKHTAAAAGINPLTARNFYDREAV